MRITDLSEFAEGHVFTADLVIVGGGPVGLTIAREFFGHGARVLVIESGKQIEDPAYEALNALESVGQPETAVQVQWRTQFHAALNPLWSQETQPYGVRCRGLGGSTIAWAGKSATFDETDFEARAWVPNSGWPIARTELEPYSQRAAAALNLGPEGYDDDFWKAAGKSPPEPRLNNEALRSYLWQFARSRKDPMDIMRFGPEFAQEHAPNVEVLVNATAVEVIVTANGTAFEGVEVASLCGARRFVKAPFAVLAANTIENPRLLLASQRVLPMGVGNGYDLVGRYLMDHIGGRVAYFETPDIPKVYGLFGFYGLRHHGRIHVYLHGLALTRAAQERLEVANASVYMSEERAADDPWNALRRLLRLKSESTFSDVLAVASSCGLLAKGLGMRAFASKYMPAELREFTINHMLQYRPGFVARQFQTRSVPHKLSGLVMEGMAEQPPDPDSRITLSEETDRLGVPKARVNWKIANQSRRALAAIGRLVVEEFPKVGLPAPVLTDWVAEDRLEDGAFIDMGHGVGTTRMSHDPRTGVVDTDCRVHGVHGLYVAGGSVFPTSGHTNPTLMFLAVSIRLADHLKSVITQRLQT